MPWQNGAMNSEFDGHRNVVTQNEICYKKGVQFGNRETIRENQAIRANLRIDSRESGHLRPKELVSQNKNNLKKRLFLSLFSSVFLEDQNILASENEKKCLRQNHASKDARGGCSTPPPPTTNDYKNNALKIILRNSAVICLIAKPSGKQVLFQELRANKAIFADHIL